MRRKINNSINIIKNWYYIPDIEVIYYIPDKKNIQSIDKYKSIYAIDLDHTLIEPKSKSIYPKNYDDWKIKYDDFYKLFKDNTNLYVIYSNQSKLINDEIENFCKKINNVMKELKINIFVFISIGKNYYRKPCIGMYELFKKFIDDDIKYRYYIGDAGGREKDFSYSDRAFAYNIRYEYLTPEELFNIKNNEPYTLGILDNYINKKISYKKRYDLPLTFDKLTMILLCGYPGSGKTSLYNKYYKNTDIVYISSDILQKKPLILKETENALINNKNVIIDALNYNINQRKLYINIAKKYNADVLLYHITTSNQLSLHLNYIRACKYYRQYKEWKLIPEIVYKVYKSKYIEPSIKEGITKIYNLEFLPFKGCFDFIY